MSYSLVSSSDWRDLLDDISTFAQADGWTEEYDNASGSDKQIALSKSNCHMAIGEKASENPLTPEAGWADARLYAALGTSIDLGNELFYGHPGSPVTTSTDNDRVKLNDLGGTLSNTWLFSGDGVSDPDYIHAVIQTAADRYTHFSFGHLDDLGASTPTVAYVCGQYYQFWPAGSANSPLNQVHNYGHFLTGGTGTNKGYNVNLLASTVPSGFPSAAVLGVSTDFTLPMVIGDNPTDDYANANGSFLNGFLALSNQLTTGGTALWPIPWIIEGGTNHCFLGVLPGVRLVDMANHTSGSVLTFGSEEWVVFPWCRKGLQTNLINGADPQDDANTLFYGLAYKKNV